MSKKSFVKICGITRLEDLLVTLECGVDAIGFIGFPPSARYITPEKVAELCKAIPDSVLKVLVVVDAKLEEIQAYIEAGIDRVQLHGGETPAFAEQISVPVWRALRLRNDEQIAAEKDFPCEYFVIDSFVKDSAIPGGTGHVADWDLTRKFIAASSQPVLLAGGITASNLVLAQSEVKPAGFDLSSGVEDSPGIKNADKIREFFEVFETIS